MYECTLRRSTNLWFIDKVNPKGDPEPVFEKEAKGRVTQGNPPMVTWKGNSKGDPLPIFEEEAKSRVTQGNPQG